MTDNPAQRIAAVRSRTHKSCDACKFRKVRCPMAGQLLPTNYSSSGQPAPNPPDAKAVLDLSASEGKTTLRATESPSPKSPLHRIQELHVDRVIARAVQPKSYGRNDQEDNTFVPVSGIYTTRTTISLTEPQRNGLLGTETPHALSGLQVLTHQGGRNSLTFFSDSRLLSLSMRLRNQKVNELVGRISTVVNGRLRPADPMTTTTRKMQQPKSVTDRGRVALYIRLYFDHVHPMLPFLDRPSFESAISSPNFPKVLESSKPWTCLYHAVLALGSQYADGGTFEPGKGESWRLFSVSLSGFSDLLLLPDSITTMQALTAMSVYGLSICGLAIEPVIMSEATRRAQMMSSYNFTGPSAHAFQKAFWTMYAIEKITSFHFGRSSGFVDSDISCPIPVVPEATIGEFNWFLHLVRFARLLSRAYTTLFSVGVSGNSNAYYLDVINQLDVELEAWQASLPDNGFRPGGVVRPQGVSGTLARSFALLVHYLYYSLLLTLSRTTLVYLPNCEDSKTVERKSSKMKTILAASRSILELTTMIEVEPYTVTWVLAGIPITALFVLFDIVIHDPRHPDTASNLALLDMVAGHFSRIEYASGGTLPGSLIAEFAKIARDYVNDIQNSESEMAMARQNSMSDPMPTGFADFSFDNGLYQVSPSALMGTDVMGIFSYFLPDLDPMFYQGLTSQYNMLPNGGGGSVG
ncbi:fungal specific transcription factor domain-containing protein [Colletotrichum incanum]|nr:fungal specific transcription factor domain-containing protein [Colletotrichum incanum]